NLGVGVGGNEPLAIRAHQGRALRVVFSPDGKRLASAGVDRVVRIWNARTGAEILNCPGHTDTVTALAFRPNGRWLASGGWDKTLRVWDAGTGEVAFVRSGHTRNIADISFSTDSSKRPTA